MGGLSPNFIYVHLLNKHTTLLLLAVPGAVWSRSLFYRFSPAVSRSPVCPSSPASPPAAPGAICRRARPDDGWLGGSPRQPPSPSSVLLSRPHAPQKKFLQMSTPSWISFIIKTTKRIRQSCAAQLSSRILLNPVEVYMFSTIYFYLLLQEE